MNRIIRFYNRNRKLFWAIVIITILGFLVLQSLNKSYKETNKNKDEKNKINIITTTKENKNKAIISEKEITKSESQESEGIINSFIDYCNRNDIENAYKILSKDCKEELYPTLEKFKDNYVKIIFESFKMHEMQLWKVYGNRYTYSVKLEEDILATGNTQSGHIQEYYTVVEEDNKKKLNINSFISKESINKTEIQENVKFKILDKNIYNEYEEYIVEVKNLTSSDICIDTKKSTKTISIKTSKGFTYYANAYEISNNSLVLKEEESNIYRIKFQKGYREEEIAETINFNNLVLNYNLDNEQIIKVTIEL